MIDQVRKVMEREDREYMFKTIDDFLLAVFVVLVFLANGVSCLLR